MEFHQVRYFLALCDTLNFTRAAERCNVSQPSLTRAIKLLEDELGGPLFHRERSRTHLTELGRTMLPYLRQVSDQTEAAKRRAKALKSLHDVRLSVGVMCTIGPTRLLDLFARFQTGQPGVSLQLRDAPSGALQDMLLAGDIDLAIFARPEPIGDAFHALRLFDERFVIAVAPGHPFERQRVVRLQDLDGRRYCSRLNCEFGEYMLRLYEQRGVQPVRPYRSERDDWIQAMVMAGLGFAFMPEFCVTLPGLVVRPLVEPAVTRTVQLVTVRGRPHSPAVGAFMRDALKFGTGAARGAAGLKADRPRVDA